MRFLFLFRFCFKNNLVSVFVLADENLKVFYFAFVNENITEGPYV